MEWTLQPGDTAAIPALRRRMVGWLARGAAPGSDLNAAELVIGELLSNALAHTAGPAWVSMRWEGTHPLLSVADIGPGFGTGSYPTLSADRTLVPDLPLDPLSITGRGLYLVARLALDVAVAPRHTGGNVVSVTLDLRHR